MGFYIEQAAYWTRICDDLKTLRDLRAAEIYVSLKNGPDKVTDGYIDAQTKLDDDYKKHVKQLTAAREQLALYEGAVQTLSNKQYSIGSLNSREKREEEVSTSVTAMPSTPEERAARRERFSNR